MTPLFTALLAPVLFGATLACVAYVKTRDTVRVLRWVADTPDRTLRRLLGASLVPGLAATLGLSLRGLPPPIALAVGGLLTLGSLLASSGLLGVEGALVEPGSESLVRVARRLPPKTTVGGRAVALTLGTLLVGAASVLCWWTLQV